MNFCLDEYCNIGYMDGIADALNSIRGFNMSCQAVVQSLSQWQKKYPVKEWENQLATFDQTLYMGCDDWTSADYISKKCGKVTIALTIQSKPQPPLYGFVYGNTQPYSQTRSNSQRELMQPDPEDEPNPSQNVEYQLTDKNQDLGMVELGPYGVVGGNDEDEESPPGR